MRKVETPFGTLNTSTLYGLRAEQVTAMLCRAVNDGIPEAADHYDVPRKIVYAWCKRLGITTGLNEPIGRERQMLMEIGDRMMLDFAGGGYVRP